MDISKQRLQQAVDAGLITADKLDALFDFLSSDNEDNHAGKFDLVHVAWFVGAFLLVFASIIMAFWVGEEFGEGGLLILTALYLGGFGFGSLITYVYQMNFLSALMLVISVLLTPLLVGQFNETLLGLEDDLNISLVMLTLLCASVYGIYARRFPLLIVTGYLAVIGLLWHWFELDVTEQPVALTIGWLTLAVAWIANMRTTVNFTFWLNKLALLGIGYGSTMFVSNEGVVDPAFFWLSLILLSLSVYLRYPSFVMTALLGIVGYLNYLIHDVYQELFFASILIAAQALLLIWLGVKVYGNRAAFDRKVNEWCPPILLKLRPTPLKEPLSFGYEPKAL